MPGSPTGSPRMVELISRLASLGRMDQIDDEFCAAQDVPSGDVPDWADRPLRHEMGIREEYSDMSGRRVQLREWIEWSIGRSAPRPLGDSSSPGMSRSRSLPTRLNKGDASSETRRGAGSLQENTAWTSSVARPYTDDVVEHMRTWPVDALQHNTPPPGPSRVRSELPPSYSDSTVSPPAMSPTAMGRIYRSVRVWLSSETVELASPPVPVRRRRRNRVSSATSTSSRDRTLYAISEESSENDEDELAFDMYITSLEHMLTSLHGRRIDDLSPSHKEAIRAKLEQGLDKFPKTDHPRIEPPPRRSRETLELPGANAIGLPGLSHDMVITLLINLVVTMMRIILVLTAFSFRTLGIEHETPSPPADPRRRRMRAPPPPPSTPTWNERENPALAMLLTNWSMLTEPMEALIRAPAEARNAPRAIAAPPPEGPLEDRLVGTAQAFARAVKRSPLPTQLYTLGQMVLAAARHVETRFGLWRNASHLFLQCTANLIHYIKIHNLHVHGVRALFTMIESFFAAIRAYQAEAPPSPA